LGDYVKINRAIASRVNHDRVCVHVVRTVKLATQAINHVNGVKVKGVTSTVNENCMSAGVKPDNHFNGSLFDVSFHTFHCGRSYGVFWAKAESRPWV
jgi:hypothetical protein